MADWETAPSGGWEDAPTSRKPLPANAGVASFAADLLGTPATVLKGLANIPVMTYGSLFAAAGRPDLSPNPINIPGDGDFFKGLLRKTGIEGLSPDNPNPASKKDTLVYDMAARGGFIPGGALPAAGSIIAEKIGGPSWAGVGAMTPAAISQVGSKLIPAQNPNAAILQKEGVSLTPGQQAGGAIKRMEDAATSIPLLGDAIKASQRRGVIQFDEAAFNRALKPIGETLPKGLKGNNAVDYTYGKLGDAYDNLLPNLKGELYGPGGNVLPIRSGQPAPVSLKQELDGIRSLGQNLPEPQRGQLNRIIENEVEKRFTTSGVASGETLKQIEEKLGKMSKSFGMSDNYDVRTLAGGVEEIQNALRRMVERVNPNHAGELAKINEGYANFKRVQNAASSVGAAEGVFTPAQLHRAVRAGDKSKDKARFSEGNALMQDLSTAGKSVLPSSVPDSGTPFRAAAMYALAHPLKAAGAAIPIGLGSLAYTQAGQGALQRLIEAQQKPALGSLLLQQGILQGILAQRE